MPPRKRMKVAETASGDATPAPSKKPAMKRKSNKSAKSALFHQIPKVVFEEIAKHLSPGDLLQLARCSRPFREMLMSKTSKHIWKVAREAHGVPNCPDDLSEPRFADLLFGKGCSFCPATRTCKDPLFELRVRACSACMASHIVATPELIQALPSSISVNAISLLEMLPSVWLKRGSRRTNWALKSQFDDVLQKLQALQSDGGERSAYITERKESTRAILKSVSEMRLWLEGSRREKSLSELHVMEERRVSIEERLISLGYSGEDLDDRFDERDWKWRTLFNKSSPLTEKAWQTIKPQLEETINLRREHAAAKFHDLRRHNRQDEMKGRFSNFRPQLQNFTRHKLFLDVDLLELPVVKALLEENDCRTAVTDERWLLVQNTLVDAVRDHAKRIEDHCDRVIEDAKRNAIDLGKHRWYETECREWEKRQEEREAEREELGSDEDDVSIFDPHPDELEEPPDELYELEDEYCFDDDRDLRQEIEEDEDRMPSRLLSASSLFEQEINGIKKLTSYADILRRRASMPIPGFSLSSGEPVAWCKENISSSAEIVDTAVMLLKYLNLPVRTSMVYMSACGKVFCCRRCYRGPLKTGVTWPELVGHFVYENEQFGNLCQRNRERNANVPLLNDHSIEIEDIRSQGLGVPVSMPPNLNVPVGQLSTSGNRYTQMSATWGFEIPTAIENLLNADDDEPAGIPWGDLDYDSSDDRLFDDCEYDDVYTEKCKLCAKLGVAYAERLPIRLEAHMKRKHGTDRSGNVLKEKGANN